MTRYIPYKDTNLPIILGPNELKKLIIEMREKKLSEPSYEQMQNLFVNGLIAGFKDEGVEMPYTADEAKLIMPVVQWQFNMILIELSAELDKPEVASKYYVHTNRHN